MTIRTIPSHDWRDIREGDKVFLVAKEGTAQLDGVVQASDPGGTGWVGGAEWIRLGPRNPFFRHNWNLVKIEREEPDLKPGLYRLNNSNTFITVNANGTQHWANGSRVNAPYALNNMTDGPYELRADTINEVITFLKDNRWGDSLVRAIQEKFRQDKPC